MAGLVHHVIIDSNQRLHAHPKTHLFFSRAALPPPAVRDGSEEQNRSRRTKRLRGRRFLETPVGVEDIRNPINEKGMNKKEERRGWGWGWDGATSKFD